MRGRSRWPRRSTSPVTDPVAPGHDPALTDSAGTPWAGREFRAHRSSGDDGSAPPELTDAVARFRAGRAGLDVVVEALREVRLLVPLIAELGDEGRTEGGLRVDKSQELSIVRVAGPDGRTVQPAFSSVDTMRQWNAQARPVPVEAVRIALAAAAEGTDLLVLDPGSPGEMVIRRPALWALGKQEPYLPSWADPEVLAAFRGSAAGEPAVSALDLAAGDPDARLAGPELVVALALRPGLDQCALDALLGRLQQRWSAEQLIADRVDSLAVKLRAVS